MYSIVRSIGIEFGINKRWGAVDLINNTVEELYIRYRKCYIELSTGTPVVKYFLDLELLKVNYPDYKNTFSELLVLISNLPLPITDIFPVINTRTAKYRDAFIAGYSALPVHPIYGTTIQPEDRSAVLLTRSNPIVDYNRLYKRALISINGFYHLTDTNGKDGLVVYDATKSLRVSNQNQIGIYSFDSVCDIKLIPITGDMIRKQDPYEKFSSTTYLHLDIDLTGKSVLLVIGGYLNIVDGEIISKVGLSDFKIDFKNYGLIDKYYESLNYIDLSSLGLDTTSANKLQISVNNFLDDASIAKYLTLSQSFFVILDTEDIFVNKLYIKKSNIYGMYVSYVEPMYPLVVGLGRHPEYISIKEDGQYAVNIQNNTVHNRIYNTINQVNLTSVADTNIPIMPASVSSGYFLEIGRDI